MTRFLLSTLSICVLLLTTFLLPQSVSARRCSMRMPLTLLALYRTSDSIYIGKYEKSEDVDVTEDTPEYSVVSIKKHYSVSSALKGETMKMLTLDDTEYRFKEKDDVEGAPTEADNAVDAEYEDEETGEESDEIKPGDQVLIFVKKNEETEAVEQTDDDAIKKMTADKLSSYESRIRELNGIFSSEKPKYSELVEWLVRCAEDPHTRWEGTFELLQSFYNIDWQEERARQPKPEIVSGITEEFVPEPPKNFETGDLNFARNLTDEHKRVLTNILLRPERSNKEENGAVSRPVLAYGDRELFELVKRWGDANVALTLLEQLRLTSADKDLSSELMRLVAAMLKDERLTEIANDYSDISWRVDSDVIEERVASQPQPQEYGAETAEQSLSETAPVHQQVPEGGTADEHHVNQLTVNNTEAADVTQIEMAEKKKTYGDLRAELFTEFLARADAVAGIERDTN